jgi:hypothetical protein
MMGMAAKVEIRDHGKIIDVPPGHITVGFSCQGCDLEFSSRLVAGDRVGASFGKCPRCKNEGLAGSVTMDLDKVRELIAQAEASGRAGGGK